MTIKLSAYKGFGERSHRKGWRVATAVGWPNEVRNGSIADEAPSDDAAIDGLVRCARYIAECELEEVRRHATRLTLAAQTATTAAANAEADAETRRLMLASLDAPATPAATRATHYAVLLLAPEMVDGVVKARVTGVYAYADGRYDEHARSVATHSLSRIVNVPADTIVESTIDVRPWG